jgi:putative FmdB family regulatory protein
MPIHEYRATNPDQACDHCRLGFDALRKLSDPLLEVCPECGQPVTQLISAPHVKSGDAHRMDPKHISKHGFTQYKKAGGGVYEKTAGDGPQYISDDKK